MDEDKVRGRKSYNEFVSWIAFLETNPNSKALLEMFRTIKDNASGYGSQRNADAAYESLQLVIKDFKLGD